DGLAAPDEMLRQALQQNRPNLEQAMQNLLASAEVERLKHDMLQLQAANQQAYIAPGASQPASHTAKWEFISQCLFVSRALDLPGRPFRNFSLLLNIFDLDTAKLDVTTYQGGSEPLTNIEGMRQLALGMNILAQAIKRHRNVYVVALAEGG